MEINSLKTNQEIQEIKNYLAGLLDKFYPIGSIYMTTNSTNPSETIGGTWIPWGSGRVPVGVDSSDNDFNTIEKMDGEKTMHLPDHQHAFRIAIPYYYGEAGGENTTGGCGAYYYSTETYDGFSKLLTERVTTRVNNSTADRGKDVDAGVKYSDGDTSENGAGTYSILQPYITCYMWKRVKPSFYMEWTDINNMSHSTYFPNETELKSMTSENTNLKTCKINSIEDGDEVLINCSKMFYNCTNLESVDISQLNTFSVEDMSMMFCFCEKLTNLNMNGAGTESVTDMNGMFSGCTALSSEVLQNVISTLNTGKVTNMSTMFGYCEGLESLDLSSCNLGKLSHAEDMFNSCRNITNINFAPESGTALFNISDMFASCYALQTLDISTTYLDSIFENGVPNNCFDSIPDDCLLYVNSEQSKQSVLSLYSNLTNVQVKS